MIGAFSIGRLPRVEFGEKSFERVPPLVARLGRRALLVTGARSFEASPYWRKLEEALQASGVTWKQVRVSGEPSPEMVDGAVGEHREAGIEVVVGIGGGSVLDASKAIAALLPHPRSVMDHLEGVGRQIPYRGPALPLIVVPTTGGTGSEATRNAVLSTRGREGFKKSFRHECLVPRHAIVDPDLLATCPPPWIAANGMDALTQLIESHVSHRSGPLTDAITLDGLRAARESLLPWYEGGDGAVQGRAGMAYAALTSGIALSQTGLGAVHGLASSLGAHFPIPHGAVCGMLLAITTQANLRAMKAREPENPALGKYARLGSLLGGEEHPFREERWEALVGTLRDWTETLALPRLRPYGVEEADLDRVVLGSRGGSMETNPIVLTDAELREILEERL